jgi:hypothetical protein
MQKISLDRALCALLDIARTVGLALICIGATFAWEPGNGNGALFILLGLIVVLLAIPPRQRAPKIERRRAGRPPRQLP